MPRGHDNCHVTPRMGAVRLRRMDEAADTPAQSAERSTLIRIGCVLMIAAAGMRAAFTALFELDKMELSEHWPLLWFSGYAALVIAYALASREQAASSWRMTLLVIQSVSVLYLVWLYPNFLITALLVVVAWQIAWSTTLRRAIAAVVIQSLALAAMKCTDQAAGMSLLVLVSTCGFELFAVSAAHLARSEAIARERLMRANAELRATHALLAESTRMAERLKISRDLHDAIGHSLTSLTVHLDVAGRLAQGDCVEHVQCARQLAGSLLDEVRDVVSQIRVQPVDLRATLKSLTEGLAALRVNLIIPDDLAAIDAVRADAILRCVQELITNTLRHAQARELLVEIRQSECGGVVIRARDDGRGGENVAGHGLVGMRERFESLGGKLSINSAPGRGFSVDGYIPAAAT
jgi:signal transduction histidine kinase